MRKEGNTRNTTKNTPTTDISNMPDTQLRAVRLKNGRTREQLRFSSDIETDVNINQIQEHFRELLGREVSLTVIVRRALEVYVQERITRKGVDGLDELKALLRHAKKMY